MYFKEENEFLTWDDREKILKMRRIAWEVDIAEELDYTRAD